MYKRLVLAIATVMGLAAGPKAALAAAYSVDCGSSGSSSLIQAQLAAMTGSHNTLTVTGTCVGDVGIQGSDYLSIQGLSLTGTLSVQSATHTSIVGLTLYGAFLATDHASLNVSYSTVNGYIQVLHESSATFANMTVAQWVDPASGAGGSGIICLSSSECSFSATTVSGTPSGDPITPSIGIQAASGSRFNFASGRISGFDYGVHVWNNATAFFNPDCNSLSIDSNVSIGVYVRDGGIVKLEGLTPDAITAACPGNVLITNNGRYGVLAEGGGAAFLYRAQINGHSLDSVRVQNGSVAKIRSSSIEAATGSRRSARVSSQAHLWFNEEAYGPSAASTLAGPVCIANNSSVDTENSSTQIRTIDRCTGP
jgi:hypothetical protein